MADTAARLLRLLALLQSRADWTGPQLAERLAVTTRTIRKDVDRLRALGYPVDAAPGAAGGYRLGAGASLPPLLLDDDEAVAVAIGLRMAAGGAVSGLEEASVRALATLDQVLPSRLRRRVTALHEATLSLPGHAPAVDAEVLAALASAVRAREQLRFHDAGEGDAARIRTVEPQRLVHAHGAWHLVAWDPAAADWCTLAVETIRPSAHRGTRFARREDPEGDLAGYVEKTLGRRYWAYRARVKVLAPAARVAARVPPAVVVEAVDDGSCFANVGADDPRVLAFWLAMMDEDFEAGEHPELAAELRALAARYVRAADASTAPSSAGTVRSA